MTLVGKSVLRMVWLRADVDKLRVSEAGVGHADHPG